MNMTAERVRGVLEAHRGAEEICFTSGEPTTRPELALFIRWARDTGCSRVSLMTNGRRLAYAPYLASLVDAGLNRIYVSIHGDHRALHDSLTRTPGSFEQTLQGTAQRSAALASGDRASHVDRGRGAQCGAARPDPRAAGVLRSPSDRVQRLAAAAAPRRAAGCRHAALREGTRVLRSHRQVAVSLSRRRPPVPHRGPRRSQSRLRGAACSLRGGPHRAGRPRSSSRSTPTISTRDSGSGARPATRADTGSSALASIVPTCRRSDGRSSGNQRLAARNTGMRTRSDIILCSASLFLCS